MSSEYCACLDIRLKTRIENKRDQQTENVQTMKSRRVAKDQVLWKEQLCIWERSFENTAPHMIDRTSEEVTVTQMLCRIALSPVHQFESRAETDLFNSDCPFACRESAEHGCY